MSLFWTAFYAALVALIIASAHTHARGWLKEAFEEHDSFTIALWILGPIAIHVVLALCFGVMIWALGLLLGEILEWQLSRNKKRPHLKL